MVMAADRLPCSSMNRLSGGSVKQHQIYSLSPRHKVAALRDGPRPSVCVFVCHLERVLVGHWPDWPSSAGGSARHQRPERQPVRDILMAAGAYRVVTKLVDMHDV